MYCIECGAQIPDYSKFCPHCGKKQIEGAPTLKEKIAEVIVENTITRQVTEAHKSSIDFEYLKKSRGYYLAWVLLHLGLLLIASSGMFDERNMGSSSFWPFGNEGYDGEVGRYDITEFLVYTIFPLAILVIWSMIRTQEQNNVSPDNDQDNKG